MHTLEQQPTRPPPRAHLPAATRCSSPRAAPWTPTTPSTRRTSQAPARSGGSIAPRAHHVSLTRIPSHRSSRTTWQRESGHRPDPVASSRLSGMRSSTTSGTASSLSSAGARPAGAIRMPNRFAGCCFSPFTPASDLRPCRATFPGGGSKSGGPLVAGASTCRGAGFARMRLPTTPQAQG